METDSTSWEVFLMGRCDGFKEASQCVKVCFQSTGAVSNGHMTGCLPVKLRGGPGCSEESPVVTGRSFLLDCEPPTL